MKSCIFSSLLFAFALSSSLYATDKPAKPKFTVKTPFEQRVFIENRGQYFVEGKLDESAILYGSRESFEHYYFTKTGITIMAYNRVKRTEKEIEAILEKLNIKESKKKKGEEEKEYAYKNIPEFHQMEWLGSNPNVQVVAEEKVTETYNYSDARHPKEVHNILAHAFKKITYKNLYPNIDVEYYFPEGKSGYKYNIILHPGADASVIKMQYDKNEKILIDTDKNIQVKSSFGTFIDHAPSALTASNKNVICAFSLDKNVVSFVLPKNIVIEETVIDPWVNNTSMVAWNSGYDVDYDNYGNVYVCGGSYPYQIKKYAAGGALIWTFSCASFIPYSGSDAFYGDFAVDRRSGSVYTTEGYDGGAGAMVIKVSALGAQIALFAGNIQFNEMWRMGFSRCTNQAVIAGGGTSSPSYQACYLDSNLTALSPVNINGGTHDDVALLALDNYGSAYVMSSNSGGGISGQLVKLPLPGLLPVTWQVNANYMLPELSFYYNIPAGSGLSGYGIGNGFNGITTSNTKVYTYDGYALKKWNGTTGALMKYMRVNFPPNNDSSKFRWSGITSDDCDNIFVGSIKKVLQYDGNLNLVNTYNMTDTVYDVMIGPTSILYTTGKAFVSSTQLATPPCTVLQVQDSITNASCINPIGSATITVTNGTPTYTITWNTLPVQTGSVVSNLGPGTYIATIVDNSCPPLTTTDTIIINNSGGVTAAPVITNVTCNGGNNGAISIVPTGTVVPTYTWSTGSNASSITNLNAGTYTVSISGGSCTSTLSCIVTQPTPLSSTVTPGVIKCFGDTASISIAVSGGTPTYTVAWNTVPAQTGLVAHGLIAGTYTGGFVDLNGCPSTFTTTLTQPVQIVPSFTTNSSCFGSPLQFTDLSTGGPFTGWSWTFGDGGTAAIQNPPHTYASVGTFVVTLTVTTANTCTAVTTQNITISPALAVIYSADTVCLGTATTFIDNTVGVPAGATYNWSFGDGGTSNQATTVTHTYLSAIVFTSTLTITNLQGCISTGTLSVLVKPIPIVDPIANVDYCPNQNTNVINFTSTPGGALSQFFWTNLNPAIGLAASGGNNLPSFTTINAGNTSVSATILVLASLNGCIGPTTTFTITVNPFPIASFLAGTKICQGSPTNFVSNSTVGSGFISQWFWDLDGDGIYNNATSSSPQYTFATAGTHTVGLVVESNKGCLDTVKETVFINYLPQPAFVGDNLQGCPILPVNFTDNSTIVAGQIVGWSWNFGNGQTSNSQFTSTVSYNNSSPTINASYTVSLTVTSDSGCVASLTKPNYIVVYPHPLPGFSFLGNDFQIDIIDPTVHFYDQSVGATSISWYLGDIFTQNPLSNYTSVQNPIHTYWYDQPYTYYVTQWVTNSYGCIDSIKKPVEVKPNFTFYIPNAFSPDGDGINEGFKGTGIGIDNSTYSLMIFDRWGMLCFKSNDMEVAWDGKIKTKGDIVEEDVYVWKVQFNDNNGMKHHYHGTVSLIK